MIRSYLQSCLYLVFLNAHWHLLLSKQFNIVDHFRQTLFIGKEKVQSPECEA